MKTIIPILAITLFLVGCGNNSMNGSNSTNSVSSEPPTMDTNAPATNDVANGITNTNIPASTNQ